MINRSRALAIASVVTAAVLGGCTGAGDPANSAAPTVGEPTAGRCAIPSGPVAVVVSGRANSPGPVLPARVREIVQQVVTGRPASRTGPALSLVGLDGRPGVLAGGEFYSDAGNNFALEEDRRNFLATFETSVRAVRASAPEVDVLAGLDTAAGAARDTAGEGTVAVVDSGLSTAGPLDFSVPHVLTAPVDEVIDFLRAYGAIPDLTGLTVILGGIGDAAAPQDTLSPGQRRHLVELWTKIAQAGGATCVEVITVARSETAPDGVPPVKLVPIDPPPVFNPGDPGPTVLPDDDTVGFVPNKAEFRNPEGVRGALKPFAKWLADDRSRRVTLTGTTARVGAREGQIALGTERAAAVKSILVELGADPNQIDTVGVGSYFPEYVPDHDANDILLPGPAQQNRTVRITPA
ncbi:MAG: OmpA family protein [Pseudonocardiaceae bacterium]